MNAPTPSPGVHSLVDTPAPKGWKQERWNGFVADAWSFEKHWAQRAIELGWTSLELFGCDPKFPNALHAWGAVMFIGGCKVVEITPHEIFVETGREAVDPETGEVTANRLRNPKREAAKHARHIWEIVTRD